MAYVLDPVSPSVSTHACYFGTCFVRWMKINKIQWPLVWFHFRVS